MVEQKSIWGNVRALGETLRNGFAPAPLRTNRQDSLLGANPEVQKIFSLIEARIEEARGIANARGDRPTLEDYRQACVAFGATEAGHALAADGRWNPRVYSNFGVAMSQGADAQRHDLSGFALSEPKKRPMTDMLDLDGDHAISDFYTNIDFTGANLKNAYVDPATSFNQEIAKAKNLEGLTFNNMREGDIFEFGEGAFNNIRMTGINGGKIIFGDGSRVNGLTIDGISAEITLGDEAHVNNITVNDNFRIVNLSMGKDATLSGSNLSNATISMASKFGKGATLQNVDLGPNVNGLDFSNLALNNVTIDGVPIKQGSDLAQFGISYNETTKINGVAIGSPAPKVAAMPGINNPGDLASIIATASNWQSQIDSRAPVSDASPSANPPTPLAKANGLGITGGETVDFNNITQTVAVASMERTVPLNEQATGANMNMDSLSQA
jgi:uncharacterized protein YjbI with pentapeptide repeats